MAKSRKRRKSVSRRSSRPAQIPPSLTTSDDAPEPRSQAPFTREFIEQYLLGFDGGGQRFTQDGPVLPEVWMTFATTLTRRVPLLISPYYQVPAGLVARELLGSFDDPEPGTIDLQVRQKKRHSVDSDARVAYLDQVVAANLTFDELITIALPLTDWWWSHVRAASKRRRFQWTREVLIRAAIGELIDDPEPPKPRIDTPDPVARFVMLAGLMAIRGQFGTDGDKDRIEELLNHASGRRRVIDSMVMALADRRMAWDVLTGIEELADGYAGQEHGSIYSISLNRTAFPAVSLSVDAIKADAAKVLFKIDCSRLTWAIIDSGIDAFHPAFLKSNGDRRVLKTYDFTYVRDLLWFDRLTSDEQRKELIDEMTGLTRLERKRVESLVQQIAADVAAARKVNWALVAELLFRKPDTPPYTDHGTHVASILGGVEWDGNELNGVCTDINLYDLRVLGKSLEETEFAVIAALQFVRQLNERGAKVIHGANLSLSIPHDVRNYACGRTPVCEEAERLVASSVTVVAAAGNFGYQEYQTSKGLFPGYCAISITDPGNAENVITVGATHRFRPHTYGVSYFSSRGPTGDGRLKPDIVAPGEKIVAALPNGDYGPKDGTSMAAPHVSGAAAMLMARYAELIDDPKTIKRVLMEAATDLGREKYFQGEGMLDVLRAMQKV